MFDIITNPVIEFIYFQRDKAGLELNDFSGIFQLYDDVIGYDNKLGPAPQKLSDLFLRPSKTKIKNLITSIDYVYQHGSEKIKDLLFDDIEAISQYRFIIVLFQIADAEDEFPFLLGYELISILEKNNHDTYQILATLAAMECQPS